MLSDGMYLAYVAALYLAIEQRAGGLMRQSMLHAISSTRPLFLSRGFSVEDVERLAEGLRAELEESRIQQYMRVSSRDR